MSYHSKSWTATDPPAGPRDDGVDGAHGARKTDLLFEVLAHEHRRIAIAHLVEQDGAVRLDDLVSVVADVGEWPAGMARAERESRVAAGFHHAHLGRLRDADMIVYDPELRTVRPTEDAVLAAHVLDGL